MSPPIQSFKKSINHVSASFTAGFQQEVLATGVDSIAAGQTTLTDGNVPTGSLIKYIEIQLAIANVVEAACFVNVAIQYRLSTQTAVDPDLVGGNPQRNQVLHQELFSVGGFQNSTHKFKFKIPKKFQRMREGQIWTLAWRNSATVSREVQAIYKFYR